MSAPILNLSEKEFGILLEAIDSLPFKEAGGDLMKSIMTSLVPDEEFRKEVEAKLEVERKEREAEMEERKELACLAKAKLYAYRRELRDWEMIETANRIVAGA